MTTTCLGCGALIPKGPRCRACRLTWERKRNARPERAIYGGDWPAESRALRSAEPWCHATHHAPRCRFTVDLTVDHPTRLVLSRSCHAALENERRRAGGGSETGVLSAPIPAPSRERAPDSWTPVPKVDGLR